MVSVGGELGLAWLADSGLRSVVSRHTLIKAALIYV